MKTWGLIAKEFPDWSLTMVGDGPSNELYRTLAQVMPDARIRFTGSVKDTDAQYEAADLLCMPSRYEGLPVVMLEAAAWGLPMVAMEGCLAAKDVFVPGMGALAQDNTPESLATALRQVMSATPAERRQMGAFAQDTLCAKYKADLIYDQWEALLVRAAANKGHMKLSEIQHDEWNEALITEAALEIAGRDSPLNPSDNASPAAIIARQRAELASGQREYQKLAQKYEVLLSQFRMAARKGKR